MLKISDNIFRKQQAININGKLFDLSRPKIMGIINCTPDSFYSKSRFNNNKSILKHVSEMIDHGADIIDVGGASTRPGAKLPEVGEEMSRVIPVVEQIREKFPDCIISIDTCRSKVARKAAELGVGIINDVSAFSLDPEIINVASEFQIPYVLTYFDKNKKDERKNITMEMIYFFSKKIRKLKENGIHDIIIDPGFGFNKTIEENYNISKHFEALYCIEKPILVGVSRKSMIYKKLGVTPEESLNGTTILNTFLGLNGASIFRVHDVKETKEILELLKE